MFTRLASVLVLLALITTATACGGQFIHRVNQQQGNVITDTMLEKLKPGMNREQVQFVLGLPVLKNTFNSSRWDYIYTYAERSQNPEKRNLTLYFDEDKLVRVAGHFDLMSVGKDEEDDESATEESENPDP